MRRVAGFAAFEAVYRELRPLDDRSLAWHHALHCARTLVLVAGHRRTGAGDGPGALWDPVAGAVARCLQATTGVGPVRLGVIGLP